MNLLCSRANQRCLAVMSRRGERLFDCLDRLIDQVLGDLADDAAFELLMAMLANLPERLRIGRDHDRLDPAAQRLGVEPLGDRCAVRQFVNVGAAVALARRILMTHPGAEVGEREIELLDRFELRLERRRFWREALSEAQRASLRRFLAGLGYNQRDEELMLNEAQALLMHTPDVRAFNAEAVGIPQAELAELRTRFWRSLPANADEPAVGAAVSGR